VTGFDLSKVHAALASEIVPVVSPVASEEGTKLSLNVNADLAASALAAELKASKLVYLSDVLGLMRDPSDQNSLIHSLGVEEVEELIEGGVIGGGMIPKVRSSVEALNAGVGKVHMVDGRISHSLLLEIFTEKGIGTEIVK
jgi:acetylglutamate kinase